MARINLSSNMDYGARRKRRDAVKLILAHIIAIRDAEQRYLDNMPENFQGSELFEVGECAVDALDELACLLGDVY